MKDSLHTQGLAVNLQLVYQCNKELLCIQYCATVMYYITDKYMTLKEYQLLSLICMMIYVNYKFCMHTIKNALEKLFLQAQFIPHLP